MIPHPESHTGIQEMYGFNRSFRTPKSRPRPLLAIKWLFLDNMNRAELRNSFLCGGAKGNTRPLDRGDVEVHIRKFTQLTCTFAIEDMSHVVGLGG